jgi:hypothetical protein
VAEENRPTEAPIENPGGQSDPPLSEAQDIGSASRSCLVIMALAVAILLLVCVSWIVRLIF